MAPRPPLRDTSTSVSMEQWQAYSETANNHQPPYHHSAQQQQQQQQRQSRELKGSTAPQHLPPSASGYDSYHSPTSGSQVQSSASSPAGAQYPRQGGYNGDGDVTMQDADPYGKAKPSSRTNLQHQVSAAAVTSRNLTQYGSNEEASAARRYSPMDTLSPSSPYSTHRQQSQASTAPQGTQTHSSRQSPTRQNNYTSPTQSYYSSSCECL